MWTGQPCPGETRSEDELACATVRSCGNAPAPRPWLCTRQLRSRTSALLRCWHSSLGVYSAVLRPVGSLGRGLGVRGPGSEESVGPVMGCLCSTVDWQHNGYEFFNPVLFSRSSKKKETQSIITKTRKELAEPTGPSFPEQRRCVNVLLCFFIFAKYLFTNETDPDCLGKNLCPEQFRTFQTRGTDGVQVEGCPAPRFWLAQGEGTSTPWPDACQSRGESSEQRQTVWQRASTVALAESSGD